MLFNNILKKGAQIYVEGQLTTRKWKDEAIWSRQIFNRNCSSRL